MTPETLKNPSVYLIPSPIALDAAIQSIQVAMGTKLTWLTKIFGRARTMPTPIDEKMVTQEPKVYQGSSEYYPALPNDSLADGYSFFRTNGPRRAPEAPQNVSLIKMEAPMDLIVWGNLQKIDPAKDWIFTENLIDQTMNFLNGQPGVTVGTVWDDKPEDIFKGYNIFNLNRDLLMYPFFAFRIEFILNYDVPCQP